MAAKNTVTNGHRFVFYSSEVLAVERHYIKGEPGIISLDPSALSIHTAPEAEESTRGTLNGDVSTPVSRFYKNLTHSFVSIPIPRPHLKPVCQLYLQTLT